MASTAATVVPSPPAAADPPIVDILRFLFNSSGIALSLLSRLSLFLAAVLATPLAALYHPLLYALSPILVFLRLVLDTFVLWPYALLALVFHNLYPFYVFLGVSCICALSVGTGSRIIVRLTIRALSSRQRPPSAAAKSASAPPKPHRAAIVQDGKKYR
ncbi:hypothetical protein B0H21DRAFT_817751 [Amylocystis lapponica]|nr:hypothetical protein B0H21DRAFT_817751 [Amylocystis lapponica]